MVSYSWLISDLECYPAIQDQKDIVFRVHWRRIATNDIEIVDIYGVQEIILSQDTFFTPYEDLTKAQVESWVENSMASDALIAMDAELAGRLAKSPPPAIIVKPLPWI